MFDKTIAAIVMMPITFTLVSGMAQAQNPRARPRRSTALRAAVERKDVPGVVALVTDRKGVIYQGAFGVADVATGRPLTADALFRIASMTKAITSAAAMQLIEQGKFALDDPARSTCRSWRSCRCSTRSMPRPATIAAPRIQADDGAACAHPQVGARLSVHQRDLARFQAAPGRKYPDRPAAVRAGRAMAVRNQHRRGRTAGREDLRGETRRLLPPAHLRSAQDE